jgi:TolB-like protein/Tfp pilus assembly protein PilF
MGEDEAGTLARLKSLRKELVQPSITGGHGRIVKLMGDGLLAEFPSVVEAVRCAVEIQQDMAGREADLPNEGRLRLRIGVNLGDIIVEGSDIYGDGVNIAARLESLAEPGGICISGKVYEEVRNKLPTAFEDLGEQEVKNIREPVRVYRWTDAAADPMPGMAGAVGALPLPDKPSIAVLPFENMSGDPEQEYFADGITENIITGLTRFHDIFVIAVKSSFAARDKTTEVQQIGRQLGVAHVVEGSLHRAGNRVRVTVHLIDAASGRRVWAEQYDRSLDDIFAVQDEITNIIVATLAGRIEHASLHRITHKPSQGMAVYDYLLRGRQCLNLNTKDGEIEAQRHFMRAIELDPEYAAAYAGLAVSYLHEYESNWSQAPFDALDRAYEFSQKAVTLDDADSTARRVLSSAYRYKNQHKLAKVQIERALALNPNDYHNLCTKGWFLTVSGEPAEAITCLNEAARLNPFAPDNCLLAIGMAEYTARNYESAIEAFGKATGWGLVRTAWLAACYAQLGREGEASVAAGEALRSVETELAIQPGKDSELWRAYWARLACFKNPADFEHLLEGLRKAGLPT